jgi:hypothetical protein
MPANKVYGYMKSMFGGQADKAVNVIKKIGELNARGLGETAEEFGNELSNIYTDELRTKGFFDEVKAQFGDLDKVQEFVISTWIMGAAFEVVDSDKKRAAYDSLPPEKKAQVDEVLNAVREDMESAEDKVDEYVDEQTEEVDRKQKFEKEPQKEVKTDDLGEIEFDTENIEEASEGRPSVVAESKEEPASFTEPIDLTKLEENAEKDQAGIPSEERKGEEPIETQPVTEAGEETPSPSGVVQEEQGPTQEVKNFADTIINGKKITSPEADIENKIRVLNSQPLQRNNPNGINTPLERNSTEIKRIGKLIDKKINDGLSPSQIIEDLNSNQGISAKANALDLIRKFILERQSGATNQTFEDWYNETKKTAPEATMFNEASDIKKIRNKQEKTAAETAFQEKHGVSYKKVSNINTNFATIVKNLENNNLIEKEC